MISIRRYFLPAGIFFAGIFFDRDFCWQVFYFGSDFCAGICWAVIFFYRDFCRRDFCSRYFVIVCQSNVGLKIRKTQKAILIIPSLVPGTLFLSRKTNCVPFSNFSPLFLEK